MQFRKRGIHNILIIEILDAPKFGEENKEKMFVGGTNLAEEKFSCSTKNFIF